VEIIEVQMRNLWKERMKEKKMLLMILTIKEW